MKYVLIGAGSRGMIYGNWAVAHGIEIAAVAELRPDRLANAANRRGFPMKYVLIGAGSRGMIYGNWAVAHGIEIAAVAELRPDRLANAAQTLHVPQDMAFSDAEALFALGKIADAAIIATMDQDHYGHVMQALALGYDILLEKPVSPDPKQCLEIARMAEAKGIIATMDQDHYGHVMQALALGYDILLEKPVSPDPKQCLEIARMAEAKGRQITVCHVLRYNPFFAKLKEIVDSGELGKIVAIQHAENIGNFHMAHSFVRGNWRNDALSSPIILQKSCHDLDILLWLTDAHCTKVSAFGSLSYFTPENAPAGDALSSPIILQKSCHDLDILLWLTDAHCTKVSAFGSLSYFTPENAPAGAALRCLDCPVAKDCRFDAWQAYQPILGKWPADVVCLEPTEDSLRQALETGPYGRCVYHCDNNVCDHMSMALCFDNGVTATFSLTAQEDSLRQALETGPYGRCVYHCDNNVCDHMSMALCFDNGVTATFSLTAQTSDVHRTIHIMCQDGEIEGDDLDGKIVIRRFRRNQAEQPQEQVLYVKNDASGHGGGDSALVPKR